jgi:hypothetical protein
MAGSHERERERERERGERKHGKTQSKSLSHVGAQQAQRSVDDSHNTSSCFALFSLFFLGFPGPSLSLSLSLLNE